MRLHSTRLDFSRSRLPCLAALLAMATVVASSPAASAVSCATGSQMTPAERDAYVQTVRELGSQIQAADTAAVRQATIAPVAAQFDPLAASIQGIAPRIQAATLTVNALYALKATDLKSAQDETEFFCSVPGSSLVVSVTIPQLPPGNYLLAILRATGVEHPQQISLLLQNDPPGAPQWK